MMKRHPLILLALLSLLPMSLLAQGENCLTPVPYREGFESTPQDSLPPCWVRTLQASCEDCMQPCVHVNPFDAYQGQGSLHLYNGTFEEAAIENIASSPRFAGVGGLQVAFWAKTRPQSHPDQFQVGLVDEAGQFTPFATIALTEMYTYHTVSFATYSGTAPRRIAFRAQVGGRAAAIFHVDIDEVSVDEISACPPPSDLRLAGASDGQLSLAWTDEQATAWEVCYGPAGFTPGDSARTLGVGGLPQAVLTNLSNDTLYDLYVRALCGADGASLWWGPLQAQPGVYLMAATGADTLYACSATVADDGGLTGPYSPNCLSTLVIYPTEEGHTVRVSGSVRTFADYCDYLDIFEGAGTLGRQLAHLGGEEQQFDTVSGLGPITLRFTSGNSLSSFLRPIYCTGFAVNVECEPLPPCPEVSALAVGSITGTTAQLTWNAAPGAMEYGVTLEDLLAQTETYQVSLTNSITVGGLQPNTLYEARVEAMCPGGEQSQPASLRFLTTCLSGGVVEVGANQAPDDLPVNIWWEASMSQQLLLSTELDSLNGYISSVSFLNTENVSTTRQVDLYLTPTTLSAYQTNADYIVPADTDLYFSGTFTVNAHDWCVINLDSNFAYEGGNVALTVVDQTGDYLDSRPRFAITNTPGTYRALTSIIYAAPPVNVASPGLLTLEAEHNYVRLGTGCGEFTGCLPPVVQVSEVEAHQATLDWLPGYNETAWRVQYREAGSDSWQTAIGRTTATSYTVTGLQASTDYEFLVTSLCASADAGALATASTPCERIAQLPYLVDFEGFTAPSSSDAVEPCWRRHGGAPWERHPYRSADAAYDGVNSIYFRAAQYPWLIMPQFEASLDSLVLTAQVMSTHAAVSVNTVRVGVILDPDNLNTFIEVGSFTLPTANNRWYPMEVEFSSYHGPRGHIAITTGSPTNDFFLDHLLIQRAPNCRRVVNAQVAQVGDTSALLTWQDTVAANDYTLLWGPVDDPALATDSLRLTDTTGQHQLAGLATGSRYYAWIRTNCADEASWWRPFGGFTTQCVSIDAVPWAEGFESYATGDRPACWQVVHAYEQYPCVEQEGSHSAEGRSALALNGRLGTQGGRNTVALPDIASRAGLQLTFQAKTVTGSEPSLFTVGVVDDFGNYLPVDTIPLRTDYTRHTVYLDHYPATGRVAFQCLQRVNQKDGRVYIDQIVLDSAASCPIPSNFTLIGTMAHEAGLRWRENGSATRWQVSYSEQELADPARGTLVSVDSMPCVVSGLNIQRIYHFYVRAVCGDGDTSLWCGYDAEGRTQCEPVSLSHGDYTEGFEEPAMDDCWSQEFPTCQQPWQWQSQGAALAFPGSPSESPCTAPHGGQYNAAFLHSFQCANAATRLITPLLDLSGLSQPMATFWHVQPKLNESQDTLRLYYRNGPLQPWTLLASWEGNISSWQEATLELPNPTATYQLAFLALDGYGYGIGLDDLSVYNYMAPPCDPVSQVAATAVGVTSITLDWNAPETDPVGYLLEYGPSGFAPGTGDTLLCPAPPLTVEGLDTAADYDFYLRTLCYSADDGERSAWSGPFTFATELLCHRPTGLVASDLRGNSLVLDWSANSEESRWRVAVRSLHGERLIETDQHPLLIDGLIHEVDYSLLVQALCRPGRSESEWSDSLSLTTPTCLPVEGLTLGAPTASGVTLSWSDPNGASVWVVLYGEQGFDIGNSYADTVHSTSHTLTGLAPATAYEVAVQALCDPLWPSAYTPRQPFTTLEESGVRRVESGEGFRLWPNPCAGELSVESGEWNVAGQELIIVDLTGRVVFLSTLNSQLSTLHLQLAAGTYFVKLGPAVQKLIIK